MGFFNSLGGILNDATGATAAAKLNHQNQKEFAQNAHQWEMEDMRKAGLNPILSAGGSGASASGGGANAAGSMAVTDIANSAIDTAQTLSNIKKQKSEEGLNTQETINKGIEAGLITPQAKAKIQEMTTKSALNNAQKGTEESQRALNSAKTTYTNERARGKEISVHTGGQIGGKWGAKGEVGGTYRW